VCPIRTAEQKTEVRSGLNEEAETQINQLEIVRQVEFERPQIVRRVKFRDPSRV
jgi:hypothetical protein